MPTHCVLTSARVGRLTSCAGPAFRRALPLVAVALMVCSITGLPDSAAFTRRRSTAGERSLRTRVATLHQDSENAESPVLSTGRTSHHGSAHRGGREADDGMPEQGAGGILRELSNGSTVPGAGIAGDAAVGKSLGTDEVEGKASSLDVAAPIHGTTFNGGADGEQVWSCHLHSLARIRLLLRNK